MQKKYVTKANSYSLKTKQKTPLVMEKNFLTLMNTYS